MNSYNDVYVSTTSATSWTLIGGVGVAGFNSSVQTFTPSAAANSSFVQDDTGACKAYDPAKNLFYVLVSQAAQLSAALTRPLPAARLSSHAARCTARACPCLRTSSTCGGPATRSTGRPSTRRPLSTSGDSLPSASSPAPTCTSWAASHRDPPTRMSAGSPVTDLEISISLRPLLRR